MGMTMVRRALGATAALVALVAGSGCTDDDTASDPGDLVLTRPASWSQFGFDRANTRFNPSETVLTPKRVDALGPHWQREIGTGIASTPTVVGGVVYVGTFDSRVMALDANTGETIWETTVDESVMSSVTVDDHALYVATNRHLYRLDRETGGTLWSVETSDHPIAITPSTPVVVDDLVVLGVASGELMVDITDYRFRGSVMAYEAETGTEAWRIWLTSGDDKAGNGVGVWSTAAVDEDLGLVYFGTGNTYEPPSSKYSDGIIAVDYRKGSIAWMTQFTNADVWSTGYSGGLDADVGAGPNLFSVGDTKAVGAGDKQGAYRALDRRTGKELWKTKMTDGSVLGGVIGTSAFDGTRIYVASNNGDAETNAPTSGSTVLALDPDDGGIDWKVELDGTVYAPVSVSPDLVWVATTAADYYALDAKTGKTLWTAEAPDQIGSGASIVDGVVYWGYGFTLFGPGSGKGGMFAFGLDAEGATTTSAPTSSTGGAASGADMFRRSCASCHGLSGEGGTGPSLVGIADRLSEDKHRQTVAEGRPGTQMPSFKGILTEEEIAAIVEYERTELQPDSGG